MKELLTGSFGLEMLEEALGRGRPEVFNTDQGVQVTAEAWTDRRQTDNSTFALFLEHQALFPFVPELE